MTISKGFVKVEGIKCDNCDYENKSIPMNEYHLWIDRQCPNCGTVLLTENDYNTYKLLTAATAIANKLETDEIKPTPETSKVYNIDKTSN